MNHITLLAVFVLTFDAIVGLPRWAEADEPHAQARVEPAKPFQATQDTVNIPYQGTVTEVTKDSITIQWPGEKPKKFSASEILASGKYPTQGRPRPNGRPGSTPAPPDRYRLTDVKVGDEVYIRYAHLGGADICDCIRISRRPGGRVPPLPEGAEPVTGSNSVWDIPYHEEANAHWDLVEKGIPYPEKFGSRRLFPEAPMPREVRPRISQ